MPAFATKYRAIARINVERTEWPTTPLMDARRRARMQAAEKIVEVSFFRKVNAHRKAVDHGGMASYGR